MLRKSCNKKPQDEENCGLLWQIQEVDEIFKITNQLEKLEAAKAA